MSEVATKRFVWAVVTAAIVATIAVAFVQVGFDQNSLQVAGTFGLLGVIAEALAYQRPRGGSGSISFIPFLSAVGLAPSLAVVLSVGLAVTCGEILQKRAPLKVAFNVAQYVLAVALAVLVFRGLGGLPIGSGDWFSVVPFGFACLVFLLTNTIAVSGVIAVDKTQRFLKIWKQVTRGSVVYDLFALPVVYILAFIYHIGPEWAVAAAFPLFGLRQLYKTNWELQTINQELLQLMVATVEARDPYTSGHSQRVAQYSRIVSRAAALGSRSTERVFTAALLHDVGKIHEEFAPILRKPGRLTDAEFDVMKTHSEKGAILVGKVSPFRDLIPAVRGHHEAWDGSGYPDGLVREQIPLWARVIAFADTIDAMTTDRPYRKALGPDSVRVELRKEAGLQFDPTISMQLISERHWPEMANAIRRNSATRKPTPLFIESVPRHSAVRRSLSASQ